MLSHKLNPSDRALQEDARKKPSLIEGQGKVVLKAGSRLDIDMSGSLSEILKAIKPLQTGKMTRESIKNSPFAMIGHNHYHNDLKRLNTGNYLHLTSLEYQQLCELPGMIAGKEDAGVAAGLVAAHETQWNHDSFLTELPEHDHSHNNLTGLNTGDDYLHLTQTEYQLFLGLPTAIATKQSTSEKGQANGYASLDSAGKVPIAQLPNSIMEYKGTWNAATNSPALANGSGNTGDVYRVSVTGTQFGYQFNVGDYCIYNGSTWEKSDTTDSVASVDGRTGAVSLSDKYQPLDTDLTTIAGLTHSNRHVMVSNGSSWTRRALEEADLPSLSISKITGLQSVLDGKSNTSHTHPWSGITDKPASIAYKNEFNVFTAPSGISIDDVTAEDDGTSTTNWNAVSHLQLVSNNNKMAFFLGHPQNERKAFIQVGHASSNFASYLGELRLNPFGGNVTVNGYGVWHSGNFNPDDKAALIHTHPWSGITDKPSAFTPSAHGHAWNDITGKPSTFAPAAHTLVSHTDWSTYFDQALKTTSSPTFASINISNGGLINDWAVLGTTHNPSSPYEKRWYKAYELTGTGFADEDIELRVRGDVNYYYGACIVRLKITRDAGEPANQLHVTITPISGWPSNALVKVDGGIVWVASNLKWGDIYGRLVQSRINPGRVLFNTTYTQTEPAGVSINGTFGVKTYDGDAQKVVLHNVDGANGNFTGSIDVGGTVDIRGGIQLLNKAGNGWLSFAARDVSGSEAVADLTNVGSITPAGSALRVSGDIFLWNKLQLINRDGGAWDVIDRETSGSGIGARLKNITKLNGMNVSDGGFSVNGDISISGNRVVMSRRNVGSAATINITTNPQIIDLSDYSGVSRFNITTSRLDGPAVYFKNAEIGDEVFVKIVSTGQYPSEYDMVLGWNLDTSETWMHYSTKRYFHLICEGTATQGGITANTWWMVSAHGLYQP